MGVRRACLISLRTRWSAVRSAAATAGMLAVIFLGPAARADDLLSRAAAAEREGYLKQAFALYLQAYAASSDEAAVRRALVRLAPQLDPPPEIPEEARRRAARGQAAVEMAADAGGFEQAAAEFRSALRAAPWWADITFNLALVQERLGQYDAAIENINLYLASEPADADQVRSKLYQIEYRKEQSAPATVFVYRTHNLVVGRAGTVMTRIDGTDVARLRNGTWFRMSLRPGVHTLQWWVRALGITHETTVLTLDVKPRQSYYVALSIGASQWGWTVEDASRGEATIRTLRAVEGEDLLRP